MGRAPDPNAEELEFIFQKFADGLDDKEVLNEIDSTSLPRRNRRFIYQRRLHWNAAKKILETEIQRKLDPVIVGKRKEHFAILKEMTISLLNRNMDSVTAMRESRVGERRYLICDTRRSMTELSREELSNQLNDNEERTRAIFTDRFFAEYFLPHITYENDTIASKGWNNAIDESPYEVIKTLRLLMDRGTFKGICPVCEDWK